jgi:hypothetical protein
MGLERERQLLEVAGSLRSSRPIRMAMMAMTTSSSISVNPRLSWSRVPSHRSLFHCLFKLQVISSSFELLVSSIGYRR